MRLTSLLCLGPHPQGFTEDVDSPLVYGDPQGASPMLHGSRKCPGFCLDVVAFHAVQLVLTVVAPRSINTIVQDTDS